MSISSIQRLGRLTLLKQKAVAARAREKFRIGVMGKMEEMDVELKVLLTTRLIDGLLQSFPLLELFPEVTQFVIGGLWTHCKIDHGMDDYEFLIEHSSPSGFISFAGIIYETLNGVRVYGASMRYKV